MTTGSFSDWGESKILDHIFGGVSFPTPTLHLGYVQTASGETGPGTEPTGSGYVRVSVPPALWLTSTAQETTNLADIICPRATGNIGAVTGVVFYDSSVGGNQIAYVPVDGSLIIELRDALVIPAGAIVHKFLAGGFTNYLKDLTLNHIYKSMPMPIEPILYGGYMTTAPTDALPGTEPGAGNYKRSAKNNNLTTFKVTAGGVKETAIDIEFDEATAPQGTAGWYGWWNAPSGGQFLAHGALNPTKAMGVGDQIILDAGQVKHTLD